MTKPTKRKALDVAVEAKQAARSALNEILPQSIERRKEYGGMICADENNKCKAMPARTDDLPMTVDVGHRESNGSCPVGYRPVAYYNTHPTLKVAGFLGDYDKFSDEDKAVSEDSGLIAFVGTLSGNFMKYDPSTNEVTPLGRLNNVSTETSAEKKAAPPAEPTCMVPG